MEKDWIYSRNGVDWFRALFHSHRRCSVSHKSFFAIPFLFTTLLLMADCPNCMTCHDFCTNQSGYVSSQLDCNTNKDCHVVLLRKQSYLDSPHPGLFVR